MTITNQELNRQYNNFCKNVKYYRKLNKMTQEKLAEKADLSLSYIKQIESGKEYKNVTLNTQLNISIALNVKLKNLFNEQPVTKRS